MQNAETVLDVLGEGSAVLFAAISTARVVMVAIFGALSLAICRTVSISGSIFSATPATRIWARATTL